MQNLVLVSILSVFMAFSSGYAAEGGSHSGGGLSASQRILALENLIGDRKSPVPWPNAERLRSMVSLAANNLAMLEPQGAASQKIAQMFARGLARDIENTSYALSKKCVDETGEEKSASTLIVNVDHGDAVPSICLNIPKLASDGAQDYELVGLLFHEHARHFGFEDTDSVGFQPISELVGSLWKKDPMWYGIRDYRAPLMKDVAVSTRPQDSYIPSVTLFSSRHAHSTDIVIENIEGNCRGLNYRNDYYTRILGHLSVGQRIRIPAYDPAKDWYGQPVIIVEASAFSGKDCKVDFAISNENGTKRIETLPFHAGLRFEMYPVDLSDPT